MKRLVVFASGNGSNFEALAQAIKQGKLKAEIAGLICDQPDAYCLKRAKHLAIPAALFIRKDFPDKVSMETAILAQCQAWQADILVLAGYMRLIGTVLLKAFPRKIVNIHPSLLPKYPGLDALGQALAHGDTTLGVTVHFVDAGMDTGPILLQESFTIEAGTPRPEVESRLHALEHELYPRALQTLLEETL